MDRYNPRRHSALTPAHAGMPRTESGGRPRKSWYSRERDSYLRNARARGTLL